MNKDIYLKIASEMNDKDVLSMLSVNRKFNDPEFFRQIMLQRYPLLIKFRKEGENWKELYLRMITYILKLKEEYNFEYIPALSLNPKRLYYFLNIRKSEYEEGNSPELANEYFNKLLLDMFLSYVGQTGNVKLIEKYNWKLEDDDGIYFLIGGMIEGGRLELLKQYGQDKIQTYVNLYTTEPLDDAILSGNLEMLEYIENFYENVSAYDKANRKIIVAIRSGNLDLVKKHRYIDIKLADFEYEPEDISYITGECFGKRFLTAGSFEVFQYILSIKNCDYNAFIDKDTKYYFIEDEKIDWVRYLVNTYKKSEFYDIETYKTMLKGMILTAIQYNATDIYKYLKKDRKELDAEIENSKKKKRRNKK